MNPIASHIQTGRQGEDAAVQYLLQQGYNILARNWRYRRCEVDAIASKGKMLHFFEIKTRSSNYVLPEESVGNRKLGKLKEAASEYLFQNPQWKMIQFDILSITAQPDGTIEFFLIEDIF